MTRYIPDSVLLNHVYVPFVQAATPKIFNCIDHFTNLEIGPNGFTSVIDLTLINDDSSKERVFPFINLKKFDSKTKDWFWYDDIGFPYRIYKGTGSWELQPVWEFGKYFGNPITFDPSNILYNQVGRELGFYSSARFYNSGITMYTGAPLILTINGETITDKTIYGQSTNYNLTKFGVEENKEFYYNPSLNKIYTNQNLNELDLAQVKIHCYTVSKEVSVKCRMKANQGGDAYLTPTVDYYIVKLNGQFLRG